MKVVYIFLSKGSGVCHLIQKILPQLEAGSHGSEVVGMCFFDNNGKVLQQDKVFGIRLAKVAKERNIILMMAACKDLDISLKEVDEHYYSVKSSLRRKPTECAVITVADGMEVGCFPHLYAALAHNLPDHVIAL